jgi:glycosyltransferase involved in cell wall biosynthesis
MTPAPMAAESATSLVPNELAGGDMRSGLRSAARSATHVVLIPSYNPGTKLLGTVTEARRHWNPIWVIVDGSTDGSAQQLRELAHGDDGLEIIELPQNVGKGAALLHGLQEAARRGFSHALTMDSDGQHPAELIPAFVARSQAQPDAMVLGVPVFDASAPLLRVRGRRISNWFANLETLWSGIGDSLFGFRVYPIAPLLHVMRAQRWMRRFDFDPEAVVRLCWQGVRPINQAAPVKYFSPGDGGVSHFNYWRDNALLAWMHSRLLAGFLVRLPMLWLRRVRR